jgi:hypothetical protein
MRYLSTGNTDFTSNRFMVPAFGISGSHRMNGVLIASGGPVKPGFATKTPDIITDIIDVAPTMLYLCGQGVPDDMDGRVLAELIQDEYLRANPIRRSSAGSDLSSEETDLSSAENDEIIERLKALGYVG